MEMIPKVLVPLMIITFMLATGMSTSPSTWRKVHVGALLRGVIVMLVLGPLAALAIARLFDPAPAVVASLVLLSVVGVLPLASRLAGAAHGSDTTALVLSLVLGVLAAFTAAPSALFLLSVSRHVAVRPRAFLLEILVIQLVPIAVGVLVASTSKYAQAIAKVLGKINLGLLVVVVLLVVVPKLGALGALGWRGFLATIVFAVVIAAMGLAVGGRVPEDRRAVASIANAANVGLALKLAHSAGAEPSALSALVGVFLLRFIVGAATAKLLERRAPRREPRPAVAAGR